MNSHFFSSNRDKLMSLLDADLVIVTAYTKQQNTGDTAHIFRQEPNFWYLTGVEQADWQLVIDGRQGRTWLIAPDVDDMHQLFDGSLSYAAAKGVSGVDEIINQKDGEKLLKSLATNHSAVCSLGTPSYKRYVDFTLNPAPELLNKRLKKLFGDVKDCQKELAKLRAIKQPEEITAIKNALDISMSALENAKKKVAPGTYEYEVEAELALEYRRHNARHAFEPIIAGGKNACTLHYVSNSDRLEESNLALLDTGASKQYYSGDITRTYAVGSLTERQRAVHAAVENTLKQTVLFLKPGVSLKEYLNKTDAIMKDALLSLGLMKNQKDITSYRKYFPHAISHGLGLDVHESLGGFKTFQPGMVLTVEPGIYVPEEGIGVRIEDNILITEQGHENLSANLSTDY